MLLTPTYYVFDLYKVHQDARKLNLSFTSPDYVVDGRKIPALSISASIDSSGVTHITLVNLHPTQAIILRSTLPGIKWNAVTGQILTSEKLTDINSFNKPEAIKPAVFSGARKDGSDLVVQLPAKSIVQLELR